MTASAPRIPLDRRISRDGDHARAGSAPGPAGGGSRVAAVSDAATAARGAQGRLAAGDAPASSCPQLAATRTDRRVRRGQRRRRPDVRRRGPRRPRGRAGPAVRRPGRAGCSTSCSSEIGLDARRRVHRERPQMPPSRQPRPAAAGDRQLPGLPVPAARADPSRRWSAASGTSPRSCCAATRPGSRGCTGAPRSARSARGRCGCTRSSTRRRRSTRRGCSRRCARTSPACPSCWRCDAAAAARARAGAGARRARAGAGGRRRRAPSSPSGDAGAAGARAGAAGRPQLGLF